IRQIGVTVRHIEHTTGLVANLRKNFCRPPQKTGRAGLSGDDLLSQGFASSALGSILPPSQKAAGLVCLRGLGNCRNSTARFQRARRGFAAQPAKRAAEFASHRQTSPDALLSGAEPGVQRNFFRPAKRGSDAFDYGRPFR
ncbi:MAG TPA: hypothetical protein VGQ81_05080, partial [Acidobacteriota bacterium]|nr:hypothetical protein [Acidobacteriota bacterium]